MPHSNAEKFARTDITNMLEYLGFKISDEQFDAVLNLTIKGEPIAARYYNYGLLYTGARVEGRLSLKGKGVQKSFHFSGVSKPTPTGHPDTSETPADAPFYKAWDVSDFIPKFIEMLSNTLNIPKARVIHSAMKWQTDQMLEKLTNQLAECGEAGIVELIDIVKTKNDIKMNGARRMSAKLFGKSGTDDPKIFEALISVLQDKSDEQSVRCAVLSSFVKTKNTSVVPALIKLITENAEKNWNSYDKLGWGEYVIRSAGEFGNSRLILPLINILKSDQYYEGFRIEAARSLGKIGDDKSVPYLISFVKDQKDEGCRNVACWALRDIVGEDFEEDYSKWLIWWDRNKRRFADAN